MIDRYKMAIRKTCREIRINLPAEFKIKASKKICTKIKNLHEYRYAKHIALYHAIQGEVDLSTLWASAPLQGKYCYFPIVTADKTLIFLPATPSTPFELNKFGISEPQVDSSLAVHPDELDIIFLPLVAFDPLGTRLGMGQGYYDRTLEHCTRPLLIGVAFEFQKQSFILPQPWDVPLSLIITETCSYGGEK